MGSSQTPNSGNLLLGKGAIYFDRYISGAYEGELHLGNCETFEITPSTDVVEKKSSMDATAGTYKRVIKSTTFDLNIVGNEFAKEILALNMLGTVSVWAQGSGTLTDEQVTASCKTGRYYATSKRSISSVVVKYGTGAVGAASTASVTTDYTVDAETGRIYVVPGGAITAANKIWVSASYAAYAADKVIAGTDPNITGRIRFVGDPSAGPKMEAMCWSVQLNPDGALGLISDDIGNWTLKGVVQNDATNHPTEPYWTVTYRTT